MSLLHYLPRRALDLIADASIRVFQAASDELPPPIPPDPHEDCRVRIYVGRRRVMTWEPDYPGEWAAKAEAAAISARVDKGGGGL